MSDNDSAPASEQRLEQDEGTTGKGRDRFLNMRVTQAEFVDIKTAALRAGLSLADYTRLIHAHYQRSNPNGQNQLLPTVAL